MSTASVSAAVTDIGDAFVSYFLDATILATVFGIVVGFYAFRWAIRRISGSAGV